MKNEEYIKKWLEGTLTEEERQEFEKSEDFDKLKKLSNAVNAFKAPEYDREAEWQRLRAGMATKRNKVVKVDWTKQLMKVAAVLVILAAVFIFFFSNRATTITTSLAEKATVVLPDSSIAILNSHSSLTYYRRGWKKDREVVLNGEALFKVSKGSTFKVVAADGVIQVLGTEFNVRTRNNFFEVICYEGLVQVNKNNQLVKLPAEHLFLSVNGKTVKKREKYSGSPHLLSDESAFDSVPFKEVIEEFERQYDIKISAPGIDMQRKFTGRFTHTDLDLALKSIAIPLDLSYNKIGEKEIVLRKEHK